MERSILIPIDSNVGPIQINSNEFSLGRALSNSYVLKELSISRCHCIFKFDGNTWTILDKSSNGTRVNSVLLQKTSRPIYNNDRIELTESVKFKFCLFENNDSSSAKKRRLNDCITIKDDINDNQKTKTCFSEKPCSSKLVISTTADNSEINKLDDIICKDRALIKKLRDDATIMQLRITNLEVDLFHKITSATELEQQVLEMKESYVNLEKEKEEMQLQLDDFENEAHLLRLELEKRIPNENSKSQDCESDDEDKKLLNCVLKAEVYDKECKLKSKFKEVMSQLEKLKKGKSLNDIQNNLQDLQTEFDEFIVKRNELETFTKTSSSLEKSKTDSYIKDQMLNVLDSDLQCSICNEVFIRATSLNCGHMFCKMCILRWQKQKNTCPVCRVVIKLSAPCIALDNYIDQTFVILSPTKKDIRTKLKEAHDNFFKDNASSSDCNDRNNAGTSNHNRTATIYVSSDDSDSDTDIDTEDYSDYSDLYNNGYGGYGFCYVCGDPSHWANSCPARRRR